MRRSWLRLALAVGFSGSVLAAGSSMADAAPSPGLAFVLNSAEASISVMDVRTHAEVRRIPVLREPHHLALTPDHKFLLVGDTSGNQLFFLDPESGEVKRRTAMSDPYQLVFSPDGMWHLAQYARRSAAEQLEAVGGQIARRLRQPGDPGLILLEARNFSRCVRTHRRAA